MKGQEFLLCENIRDICDAAEKYETFSIDQIRPFAKLTECECSFSFSAEELEQQKMYFFSLFSGVRNKTLIFSDGTHLLPDYLKEFILSNEMFCIALDTIICVEGEQSHETDLFIFYGKVAKFRMYTEGEVKGLGYYSCIHILNSVYLAIFNYAAISIGNNDEFECTPHLDDETSTMTASVEWNDDRGMRYLFQCLKYRNLTKQK